jgi:hypothetical protein
LELALNDLKESMIKELEFKNRELDSLRRQGEEQARANDSLR